MHDYSDSCERCGRGINRKGNRKPEDGVVLCRDCRGSDRQYVNMRRAGGYVPTSDEQLAQIEAQLERLQREAS
jgi:hypothetical protein